MTTTPPNNPPWFILFDGVSPDGRGIAYFVERTTDRARARKHYDLCSKSPYSTGYVQIITDTGSEKASAQTDWTKL